MRLKGPAGEGSTQAESSWIISAAACREPFLIVEKTRMRSRKSALVHRRHGTSALIATYVELYKTRCACERSSVNGKDWRWAACMRGPVKLKGWEKLAVK